MPNLDEIIRGRRSVRVFKKEEVPPRLIEEMLDAARWAPSACNKQAWEFVVVTDQEIKKKLVRDPPPVIIYVTYDKRINPENYANIQSAAAAIQNALLKGHELGLGCCWVCALGSKNKIRRLLDIPREHEIVAAIFVGYPDELPSPPVRRELSELLHLDKFSSSVPISPKLEDWSFEQVANFASRSIRSTSPRKDVKPSFPLEEEKLARILDRKLPKEDIIVSWFSYPGTLLFKLAQARPQQRFLSVEFSDEIANWMLERQKVLDIRNVDYAVYSESITACGPSIMHETPNRIPDFKQVLEKAKNNSSRVVLTFANYYSFYGWYLRRTENKIIPHFGPIKPQKIKHVENAIGEAGYEIKDDLGIDLLPNAKKIMEKISSVDIFGAKALKFLFRMTDLKSLEAYSTKSFLKELCRLRVLELEANI